MSGERGRKPPSPGRASPEAIEKRRAARRFNTALLGPEAARKEADGRTERRRRRLYRELEEGAAAGGKRPLTPVDVLTRVQALLDLGEPLTRIRKAHPPKRIAPGSTTMVEVVRRLHRAYAFAPAVYRFVGIGDEVLRKAGVLGRGSAEARRRLEGAASTASPRRPRGAGRARPDAA